MIQCSNKQTTNKEMRRRPRSLERKRTNPSASSPTYLSATTIPPSNYVAIALVRKHAVVRRLFFLSFLRYGAIDPFLSLDGGHKISSILGMLVTPLNPFKKESFTCSDHFRVNVSEIVKTKNEDSPSRKEYRVPEIRKCNKPAPVVNLDAVQNFSGTLENRRF